jgi:hypothetical protein
MCVGPYVIVDFITSPYVDSSVDSNTCMDSWATLCQSRPSLCHSRLYPPARDLGFGLRTCPRKTSIFLPDSIGLKYDTAPQVLLPTNLAFVKKEQEFFLQCFFTNSSSGGDKEAIVAKQRRGAREAAIPA